MRGGHCLKVWTKKQQVVSLFTAESELYAAEKTASEGMEVQSVANHLGIAGGLNLFLDASATMCLVNRRGLGKAKHVDMQNLWIQEASKSGRFVTEKVGTSVNRADLMTNETENEQLTNITSCEFVEQCLKRGERRGMRLVGSLANAKEKPACWAQPQHALAVLKQLSA